MNATTLRRPFTLEDRLHKTIDDAGDHTGCHPDGCDEAES